jgi:septum formation protein
MKPLILASQSAIRQSLLRNAGVDFQSMAANIDEEALSAAMVRDHAKPRDIADALAEAKAVKISRNCPDALVLGCDQALDLCGTVMHKAASREEARERLLALRGREHRLICATILAASGAPIWRHVEEAAMTMREFSDEFLDRYLDRAGPALTQSVGCYAWEGLGAQLFSKVRGDYYCILGLPLLAVLDALRNQGVLGR